MPATPTSRIDGLTTSVAVKAPCLVATTAAITLSGTQTINGVACVANDRVLVKNQASSVDNGIYVCSTTAWSRARDFDGNRDAVPGTLVVVKNSGTDILYKTVCADNPVVFGTSSITFALAVFGDATTVAFTQAGTGAVARTSQNKMREIVSPEDYGAVGDGATDDTVAVQAALDYLKTVGGGTLRPQRNKNYKCASQLSLSSAKGIAIEGESASTQATGGAVFTYSGTASPFISFTSCATTGLKNMNVRYTNAAFAGTLVAFPLCSVVEIAGGSFMGNGVSGGLYGVSLDTAVEIAIRSTSFDNLQYGILGQATTGAGYANAVTINNVRFGSGITAGDIRNVGQGWTITGNSFETLANGRGKALAQDVACQAIATHFAGNWMGDVTELVTAWSWLDWQGRGLSVQGNIFNGTGALNPIGIKILGTSYGINIGGNYIRGFAKAIDIGAFFVNTCTIAGNDMTACTVEVSGTPVVSYFFPTSGTFTPTWTGLTVVGAATYTGTWQKLGQLVKFQAVITPTGAGTTASTIGTTFINNLPFAAAAGLNGYDVLMAVDLSTPASLSTGYVKSNTAQAYTPNWAAANIVVIISGSYYTDA